MHDYGLLFEPNLSLEMPVVRQSSTFRYKTVDVLRNAMLSDHLFFSIVML